MVYGAYKSEILDYLTEALRKGGERACAVKRCFEVTNNSSWYVVVERPFGRCDVALAVQDRWWGGRLAEVVDRMFRCYEHVAVIFPKDGRTFFRRADDRTDFLYACNELGLSQYDSEQKRRMIQFRQEEIYQCGQSNALQYFQLRPQGIINYHFQRVRLDSDRVRPDRSRLRPIANMLYIWTQKDALPDALRIEGNKLVNAHSTITEDLLI